LALAISPSPLQHRSASGAWEWACDSTVFKTVATVDGKTEPAKGLQRIDDRLSLSQPYGALDLPPDLAAVVEAWPELPEAIRAAILAMVRAAGCY
jgi:hypothetical protein